jgi:hypothetical protein
MQRCATNPSDTHSSHQDADSEAPKGKFDGISTFFLHTAGRLLIDRRASARLACRSQRMREHRPWPFAETALKAQSRAGLGRGQVTVIRLTEIRQSDDQVEYKDEEVRVDFASVSRTVKKPKGSRVRKLVYLPGVSPYHTCAPNPPG